MLIINGRKYDANMVEHPMTDAENAMYNHYVGLEDNEFLCAAFDGSQPHHLTETEANALAEDFQRDTRS